ncbi:hypothetical protein SAMN04487970_101545 [Paenibacillus tianmuensis]|uniref:Uncharacterized protein n=1 Tax=Paenibacillus tianmuensis TaxID=624147 RepID=A0A1G4RFU3_9BACL|nr:hypothetical protein [Paenibacillus tianmuensis]SCW55748.1 hypothetical protein SAMN04487970_101545 [Paenibacillus tianmuensis]
MSRRQRFAIAFMLITSTIILNWSYPDAKALGVRLFQWIGLPVWSQGSSGLNYVGITSILLLLAGLFTLRTALQRHARKITLLALILSFWLPSQLIVAYQSVWAKGIYALEYVKEGSRCNYKKEEDRVTGTCSLTFVNHSGQDILFTSSIRNRDLHIGSFLESLDILGDQTLTMPPRQKKTLNVAFTKIAADARASASGAFYGLELTVKSDEQERDV